MPKQGKKADSVYSIDRTNASRRSYRSGVCIHPRATLAQSVAYPADGAVQPSAPRRHPAGGSSAAPLGRIETNLMINTFFSKVDQ